MQLDLGLGRNYMTWGDWVHASDESHEENLTAVDLFAGPGGLSLGFKMAGYRLLAAVENDPSAAETYRKNHPDTNVLQRDVAEVSANDIEELCGSPDIVIGGPPCKGFSWANTQSRNSNHPGSAASWNFVRLVEEISPKAFLMENVTGFIRFDGGEVFKEFKRRFKVAGYHVQPLKLNSEDFGAPQSRNRLFLVGTNQEWEPHLVRVDGRIDVRDAIGDLPGIPEGERGREETEYNGPAENDYQDWARKGSTIVHNHVTTKSRGYMLERFRHVPEGGNWRSIPEELMSNYAELSNVHSIIYRRLRWNERAPTITNVRKSVTLHPSENRILSVREAARLQSFPDVYRFYGGLRDIQQQVADAVPPLLGKGVGECLRLALQS